MGVIWNKVWFDLWHNKTRTLLAVLSIAAGVFAVGTMFGMGDLLIANLDRSHQSVAPPHLEIVLAGTIDRETALSLKNVPGVEGVEPYNSVNIQYKLHPQDPWRPGVIYMRDNFDQQTYELVQLRSGRWPAKNDVGVERMAAQFLNVGLGDQVIFKIGNGERTLPISGEIRHPFVPPPQFMDMAFFFMNGEGLQRLGIPQDQFGSLYVRVTPYSADHAKEVATAIKDQLAKQNIRVAAFLYQDPNRHWGRTFFDGITLVLELLALVSVAMSAVLVYNTLTNLITQQTNQIGILKAIGARTSTIVGVYLANAFIYGLLALIIALPLGALVAFEMTRMFLNLFNIDYNQMQLSTPAVTLQVVSALLVPLAAGFVATLKAARLTVQQAIASYGLALHFGESWIDRAIARFGQRWLSSPYATALGNMFRRKGRLVLTELVLVLAGAAFLIVMSLMSSITATLDSYFGRQHYDTMIDFNQSERIDRVLTLAHTVPGVDQAEVRFVQSASMLASGQLVKEAGIGSNIFGVPDGSDINLPLMVAGRWFVPGDGQVIELPRQTADKNHIQVGDRVTLDLGVFGKDQWQVIGLYEPVFSSAFNSDTIYAPLPALFAATKKNNQGSKLYVRTTAHTAAFQTTVTTQLKDVFEAHNLKVAASQTAADLRSTNEFQFSSVTSMLLGLAVIVAVVGGIALMGALSISVVERTKEIGVLRAIGAPSRTIMGIFVMEGLLQGVLSCLVAVPLSWLVAQPAAVALGHAMFSTTLDYQYNWPAVGIWFGITLVISTLASILPARGATQISVRDSLSYA
jgi:putative ABC transport system permease protein